MIRDGVRVSVYADEDTVLHEQDVVQTKVLNARPVERTIPVQNILAGDKFIEDGYLHWTALANAEANMHDGTVTVHVQYGDGGQGRREWDAVYEQVIKITR